MDNAPEQKLPLEQAIKKHFLASLSVPKNEQKLLHKIFDRIYLEQDLRVLKIKLYSAIGLLATTLVLLVLAFDISFNAFAHTPSIKFISLFFSDFKQIAGDWQDYSFSILETLPLGAMAFLLSVLAAFILLSDYTTTQFKGFKKLSANIH